MASKVDGQIGRRVETALREALAAHLHDGRRLSDAGQTVLAVLTTYVFWNPNAPAVGLAWLAAVLVSAGLRWAYRSRVVRRLPDPDVRLRLLRVDVWISAALWGFGGPFLLGPTETDLALLFLIYAGLIAAATSTTVADRPSFLGFTALLLVPMAATLAWGGVTRDQLSLLLMTVLFAPFMVLVHRRAENLLREQITTRALLEISEEDADARTRFLNSLLVAAPNPIIVLDSDRRIITVNPAFERVTGHPLAASTGTAISALVDASEHEQLLEGFLAAIESGERAITEIQVPRADGSHFWMRLSGTSSAGAGVGAAILIGEDVTAQVEVREAHAEARRAAEESARAKSRFLASMSHEIRTPMNGVMGMIDLLIDSPLDPQQREWADILRSSADSLLGILNDILDTSKIDAGQLRLEAIPFDLSKLAAETMGSFGERAARRGTELALDLAPEIGHCLGDPVRIRQILSNLLSNAVKFTEGGEVSLTVRRVATTGGHDVVRMSVRDTGIGIPEDKRQMVFEEFSQADLSTTRTHGGTGLGLSIVTRLVSLMGGKVTLESEVGRGSEFIVDLPLPVAAGPASQRVAEVLSVEGQRVLVIDDNATVRRIVRSIVEGAGGSVDEAENARAGLGAIESSIRGVRGYDVAIVDAHLPILDGFAFADAVSRVPPERRPRVLMLASAATSEMAERARSLQIGGLLDKPVSPARLLRAISLMQPARKDGPERRLVTNLTLDHVPKAGRILVADDNMVNLKLAVALLEKRGFAVDTVVNGRLAVDRVLERDYDLVLMDIEMPVMDGREATREIRRRRGERAGPPIVALTAHAVGGHEAACREAGMDDFLTKPFKASALYELIDRLLGGGAPARPSASTARKTAG